MARHISPKDKHRLKGLHSLGEVLSGKDAASTENPTKRSTAGVIDDILQPIKPVGDCCMCGKKVFGGFYGRHGSSGTCGEKCEKEYSTIQTQQRLIAAAKFEASNASKK